MKRLLLTALAALLFAAPARAGVGMTAGLYGLSDGTGAVVPTIDYKAKGFLAQVHLVELIGQLPNDWFALGLGGSYAVVKEKVGEDIEGVVMPGADLRVYVPFGDNNADLAYNAMAKVRMGAEVKKDFGFGVYVVPQLGVGNFTTGDLGLVYGGGIEVSAWLKR